ncbi:RHOU [Bugula neritina]|uniref:RHOU n=2 Tax=Bugula neritina TaxID=10212 RepID=A0A7J7JBX7_BUGNE|nr:RHOU [Bugula neritina]
MNKSVLVCHALQPLVLNLVLIILFFGCLHCKLWWCPQVKSGAGRVKDDFDSLRPLCYPGTDVFLLCYSVVSPTSFHNITEKWIPELKQYAPKIPIILVGTQTDLRNDVRVLVELHRYNESPVTSSMGRQLADRIGAVSYIECSSLTQTKLKEVFDLAIMTGMDKQRFHFRHQIVSNKPKRHRGLKSLLSCFGGRTH